MVYVLHNFCLTYFLEHFSWSQLSLGQKSAKLALKITHSKIEENTLQFWTDFKWRKEQMQNRKKFQRFRDSSTDPNRAWQ